MKALKWTEQNVLSYQPMLAKAQRTLYILQALVTIIMRRPNNDYQGQILDLRRRDMEWIQAMGFGDGRWLGLKV